MSKASRLRQLLAEPGPVLCPGVYDCLSARIVERAGFPAAFMSGTAVSIAALGYPDMGLQTMTEILNQARNIARSVDIPVIADADTGYGNALNVMRTVREFEAAGLAGIMIEDQADPKRCGHYEGKKLVSTSEMVIKIQAACEARRDDDFVIMARSDARAVEGMDATIDRVLRYCEAGADIIFIDALVSVEDLRRVGQSVPKPLKANMQEGGKTPMLHYQELYELGFKLIGYSSLLQRLLIKSGADVLELLKREGTTLSAYPDRLADHIARSELMGQSQFYELEERLYGPLADSEGSQRQQLQTRTESTHGTKQSLPI